MAAFKQRLGGNATIDLTSEAEQSEASGKDLGGDNVFVKAERSEASGKTDPAPRKRRARGLLWDQHEGFGQCEGSNQLPCCFGADGSPANAAPNGRCDLCSKDNLKCLHEDLPQQITHLLVNLKEKPLKHALVRIKLVLGDAAREDYSRRRERALHRRDPNRPKRGKRTTASS